MIENTRTQSLVMGSLCSLVGLAVGLLITKGAIGDGYGVFTVAATLAAFVSGSGTWWLLRGRRNRTGALGGAVAGAIAAIVGHWICWYGILVGAFVFNRITGGFTGSLGSAPMNPLQALAGASLYGAISLVVVGWLTVPAGAILGAAIGRRSVGPRRPAARV